MFNRLCKPLKSNSFFLFGARGTGKSTLLAARFTKRSISFDLLDDEVFERLMRQTKLIEELSKSGDFEWIIIDEIQRLPKLLNTVHRMIELKKQKFALTGSSSRKLKRGSANLLAGRAFVNHLYPLTSLEIGEQFDLAKALRWGTLPKIFSLSQDQDKKAFLRSYGLTYIKEEVQVEQIVRKLEPFREFLPVAAQMSGKIINFSAIGREVGVQVPTVQSYYQILEETYIGFLLPQFHRSVRKSQLSAPKFYFFDNGVARSIEGSLDSIPTPSTSAFGELFEAFVIQELFRLNQYCAKDFRLSFYQTKNGSEVDLILSKGRRTILLEIKSADRVDEVSVRRFARVAEDFGSGAECYYLSRDPHARKIGEVQCTEWAQFLRSFSRL